MNEIDEVIAVRGQWVKSGDLVVVFDKKSKKIMNLEATSDPYYDNEDRADVINIKRAGYAKWNVARGRWES